MTTYQFDWKDVIYGSIDIEANSSDDAYFNSRWCRVSSRIYPLANSTRLVI